MSVAVICKCVNICNCVKISRLVDVLKKSYFLSIYISFSLVSYLYFVVITMNECCCGYIFGLVVPLFCLFVGVDHFECSFQREGSVANQPLLVSE